MKQVCLNMFLIIILVLTSSCASGPSAPTADYPLDGWAQVININLSGVFYGMKYQIAAMLKNGGDAYSHGDGVPGGKWVHNESRHGIEGR